jgi:hypothetical protein
MTPFEKNQLSLSIHGLWYHIPMAETNGLPETFSIAFSRPDSRTFRLSASQFLPEARGKAFSFFEDPRNLCEIAPDWLDFRMLDRWKAEVFEGVERHTVARPQAVLAVQDRRLPAS